jgi:hypothetical protein
MFLTCFSQNHIADFNYNYNVSELGLQAVEFIANILQNVSYNLVSIYLMWPAAEYTNSSQILIILNFIGIVSSLFNPYRVSVFYKTVMASYVFGDPGLTSLAS